MTGTHAPGTLARQAREALARSGGGTLHVQGIGCTGATDSRSADILVYDDAGRPTFLCDPTGAVVEAAVRHRLAVLRVPAPGSGAAGAAGELTGIVLAGHLAVVGTEWVDGAPVAVVGLQVQTVLVEHDDPLEPSVIQLEIPLDSYRDAVPDALDAAARRILHHTNDSHAAELRRFVAHLRGIAENEIAAAELVALDVEGLTVGWLDRRGAHRARIVFPDPADTPGTLGMRLRETLASSDH